MKTDQFTKYYKALSMAMGDTSDKGTEFTASYFLIDLPVGQISAICD